MTYNDEIKLHTQWYLRFCKEKNLEVNSITSLMFFLSHSGLENIYGDYGLLCNSIMEELKVTI